MCLKKKKNTDVIYLCNNKEGGMISLFMKINDNFKNSKLDKVY